MGKSFKTDGTSLVMTYVKVSPEVSSRSSHIQPPYTAPLDLRNCCIVGDDPGHVNIPITCENCLDGNHIFRQLAWSDY
jgi:hypothetical protein